MKIKQLIMVSAVLLLSFIGTGLYYQNKTDALDDSISSLTDVQPTKKHRVQLKSAPGPSANSEKEILNIRNGSGVVNYLWLADRPTQAGGYPQFDHRIRVYTNGSSIPDVNTELSLFFGYGYGEAFAPANIHTEYWQARVGGASNPDRSGGSLRLPIPFQNGIRIVVADINNTSSAIFSQVDYSLASENPGMTIPQYTLKTTGSSWVGGRANVNSQAEATLATIPAGNSGIIVGHSMVGGGASNYSYLERRIALYTDNEVNPSVESSGTEDWFGGSDYFFTGQSPFSSTGAMGLGATNNSAHGFSALVDFLGMNGGFKFNSSAEIKLRSHPAVSTSNTYASTVFYYRHN